MAMPRRRRSFAWVWFLPYVVFPAMLLAGVLVRNHVVGQRSVDATAYTVVALLGIAFCVRAATHPGLSHQTRRPWRYVGAGFVFLLVAGIGFSGSAGQGSIGVSPPPVLALVARVLFLAVLLRGLFLFETQRPGRHGTW